MTVTDANGCVATGSVTLSQPAPLVVTGTSSPTFTGGYNVSCNGASDGQLAVDFAGGADCATRTVTISGPVTRSLTGAGTVNFTSLPAGTYAVTVTDANGCTATATAILTQPAVVVANAGPDLCVLFGYQTVNCTTLSGTQTGGVAPYTVRWNQGSANGTLIGNTASVQVCPTVTTSYYYTVTDVNGCTHTDFMVVNVTDIRCGNGLTKVTICHVPPGNTGNPQTLCIAANAVAQHVPGHGGDYLGACGAGSPCTIAKSDEGNGAGASGGGASEDGIAELNAYPNPFSSMTTVRFSIPQDGVVGLRVYSMTGEEVAVLFDGMAEAGRNYEVEWKPTGVAQGIYFAKMVTAGGEVMTKKLVLNR